MKKLLLAALLLVFSGTAQAYPYHAAAMCDVGGSAANVWMFPTFTTLGFAAAAAIATNQQFPLCDGKGSKTSVQAGKGLLPVAHCYSEPKDYPNTPPQW